jgi:hypothetical protein
MEISEILETAHNVKQSLGNFEQIPDNLQVQVKIDQLLSILESVQQLYPNLSTSKEK